jgi:hypothetical protein
VISITVGTAEHLSVSVVLEAAHLASDGKSEVILARSRLGGSVS